MTPTLAACIETLEVVCCVLGRLQFADDDGSAAHLYIQDAMDGIAAAQDNLREAQKEIASVPDEDILARARWSAGVLEAAE
jgi:hypothetical protein